MPQLDDPQLMEQMRQGFKKMNPFMVYLYRLGLQGWLNSTPDWGGRILVLTHIGRKSGTRYRQPLNYAEVEGEIYCTAGFGAGSDWYKNIRKNPQVELWLPDGWWCAIAEDISDSPSRLPLMRQVILGSGVVGRLFGFDALTMSDADLDELTRPYRLLHFKRTDARTGPGGPNDLAWVWPASTCILLLLLLFKRRK